MPVNRSYGYSGYGGTYSSNYVPGMYTSNFTSAYGGRAGSQSPATLRATTPARTYGSGMAVLQEERNGRLSPTATYGYYTARKDYYTPSAYSRIYSSDYDKRQERRTINTDEIDTEEKKENRREHAIPGEITRDTTLNVRGGKAVVRMVTTKLKESPYVAGGWRARMAEKEEKEAAMTLGQRLALKHQIVEKPKVKQKSPPHAKDDSGEESEWTWETCSSSEAEEAGPPKKKKTPTPPKRKVSPKLIKQKPRSPSPPPARKPLTPDPPKRAPIAYTKSNTATLCSREDDKKTARTPQAPPRNTSASRWMDRLFGEEKPKPKTPSVRIPNLGNAVSANKSMLDSRISKDQPSPSTVVRSSVTGRPLSWAGIPGAANVQDVQANIHTENRLLGTSLSPKTVVKKPASSSSTTSSSPPLYKYNPARKQQKYNGAGSQYIESSDEDQHEVAGLGRGWRPGQPPRGDVVVKLLKDGTTVSLPVIDSEHSQALAANRALTSQAAISSRVPASMGEKYQIPGLFIKPSVKTAPKSIKPVEAKLTLKPEGTVSLTTKEAGYQSSIFTPSKSPLPTVKPLAGLSAGKTEEKEESGESEWEYYTETEPSDEEEKPVASDTVVCNGDAAVSLAASAVQASVPPLDKSPPKTLRFGAKKMPVKIEEIGGVDKKRPVLTKGDMASNKVASSAVAALRKTKPHPTPELPEPNNELSGSGPGYCAPGSGPGYSAPMASKPVQQKQKAKPLETKAVPKFIELKPTPKAKQEPSAAKPSVTVSNTNVSDSQKPVSKAIIVAAPPDSLLGSQPAPIPCTRTSAAPQVQPSLSQDKKNAPDTPNNTVFNHAKPNLVHEVAGKVSAKSAETVTITQAAELGKNTDTEKASLTVPIKAPQTVTQIAAEPKKVPEQVVSKKVNPEAVTKKNAETVVNGLSETSIKKSLETANKKLVPAKPGSSAPSEAVTKKSVETVPQKPSVDIVHKMPAETTSKKPAETVPKKPANTIPKISSEAVPKNPAETLPKKLAETASKNPAVIFSPNPATTVTKKQTELVPKKPEGCAPKPSQPSPVLSPVKAAPNNLPSPELLRRVEFDWTKSPSPLSPPTTHKSPSPCQMTAASLERLPSQLQNMFTKTENTPKEKTVDSPAWFDNAPKESGVNPLQAMNAMKADANRTQVKKSKDEDTLIKMSDTAETPWYDDEDDDMKELLKNRPTILREIDQTQDRRLTPEENMAVIKMYGGVMFPGGEVEKTPKSWLFKIRKALRGGSKEKKNQTEDGLELRAGSTSSTSSSVSSKCQKWVTSSCLGWMILFCKHGSRVNTALAIVKPLNTCRQILSLFNPCREKNKYKHLHFCGISTTMVCGCACVCE